MREGKLEELEMQKLREVDDLTDGGWLSFVVFREDDVWVAHGLQHNIVTNGRTLEEVRSNIEILMKIHAERGQLDAVPAAELKYWNLFIEARRNGMSLDDAINASQSQAKSYYELKAA